MQELTQRLLNWGCDVEDALPRFIDDEDFYLECILKFTKETGFDKLGEALKNKQYKEAFAYAHMLKGVTANLGLTPIYEKVCEIVEILRKEETLKDVYVLYRQLMEQFTYYCNIIG